MSAEETGASAQDVPRGSLSARLLGACAAVVLTPLAFVLASWLIDGDVHDKIALNVSRAADEGAAAVFRRAVPEELEKIADDYKVRLRVVDAAGEVKLDFDRDGAGLAATLAPIFFSDDNAPTPDELDKTFGKLADRREAHGLGPGGTPCRASAEDKVLSCTSVTPVPSGGFVAATESSRRYVRALYDPRYQAMKLGLVALVVALFIYGYLWLRVIRPVRALVELVQGEITAHGTGAALRFTRTEELYDLGLAFRALTDKLAARPRTTVGYFEDLSRAMRPPLETLHDVQAALVLGGLDANRARDLARALAEGRVRLESLLAEMLELAHVEAGMRAEIHELVDVSALARRVAFSLASEPRHQGTSFEVLGAQSAWVAGVPARIEQLVRDLLENAASFASANDGLVELRIRDEDGRAVRIEVADNGPAIPLAAQPRIFDRFYSTRGAQNGLGLQLAMVRAIAEAHGGSAEVTSTSGIGATFKIALPRQSAPRDP